MINHDICYSLCTVAPVIEPIASQATSLDVVPGENVSLTVSISGFNLPLNSIDWRNEQGNILTSTYDRVTIINTHNLPISAGPVLSTLLLSSVLPEDTGRYTISATNSAGSGTATFTVTVEGKERLGMGITRIYSSLKQ